jgi:ABC-type iron transport system FetAB ATPase subunit
MQNRLALLAARVAAVSVGEIRDIARLRSLRTALSIIDLREARFSLSRRTQLVIDALLARFVSAFQRQNAGHIQAELVGQLDDIISSVLQQSAGEARNDALIALDGIRLGLFPETMAYQPHESEQRSMAA